MLCCPRVFLRIDLSRYSSYFLCIEFWVMFSKFANNITFILVSQLTNGTETAGKILYSEFS